MTRFLGGLTRGFWAALLVFSALVEMQHFRYAWKQRILYNTPGPFLMAIGLLYMASEAIEGDWP